MLHQWLLCVCPCLCRHESVSYSAKKMRPCIQGGGGHHSPWEVGWVMFSILHRGSCYPNFDSGRRRRTYSVSALLLVVADGDAEEREDRGGGDEVPAHGGRGAARPGRGDPGAGGGDAGAYSPTVPGTLLTADEIPRIHTEWWPAGNQMEANVVAIVPAAAHRTQWTMRIHTECSGTLENTTPHPPFCKFNLSWFSPSAMDD